MRANVTRPSKAIRLVDCGAERQRGQWSDARHRHQAPARGFVANLVVRGHGCSPQDIVGPVDLDRLGRPTSTSTVIDLASRRYAPPRDALGRARDGPPDVGAYEFRLTN